ncbi:putative G-type lectin S-receptor-like serine/threonine-protein kinase At1g61610 [Asparagus officinalis]|uniref:putative G-type lectin S-receptor-like serine/threonine-protein kinase At1g61610 n=1 Tax=Asparagus officinalis TaxID=4686 RepID=UPI00098E1075|nr:putative G-type lectin S-receptor-like serine/threonine-protein kinase At1g61610 [Asparagus officinalis]
MNSIPILPLIILYLPSLFILSQPTDTLTLGISLTDGNSLVSSSNIFELGFFSMNNSNNRYIGIWYHDFSPKTVIWVANRETPLTDSSGSLKISPQRNLILLNSTNSILWSSNTSSTSPNETTLTLLDSGNLQLNDSRTYIWQSFDDPTDTYLPGMKIGLDLASNKNQLLTSWKNTEDPRAGNFSIGMDPDRSTQIFIWEGSKLRWRTGRWNGQVFIGIEYMVPFYIDGFQVSNYEREGKMYFFYPPGHVYRRFVLTWDGILEHRVWDNDTKAWSNIWAQPSKECEFYNKCGNGAICEDGNDPICTCLQGFVPKSMKEWSNGDWSNGCFKRTPLKCERSNSNNESLEEEDGFLKLESLKVPDSSDLYQDANGISGCRKDVGK